MKVNIISDVPVSPNLAAGDAACVCAFPDAALRAGGDIFCAYRRGTAKHGPDGALMLQRSGDSGRTWSEPMTVFDRSARTPPETVISGGLIALDRSLAVAFTSCEMLNTAAYVFGEEAERFPHHSSMCHSRDDGRAWTEPHRMDISPYGGARCGIGTGPFLLPDGALCALIEVHLSAGPQGTAAMVSRDGGRAFSKPELVVGDETGNLSLCDARLTRLRDGAYLMHLWTFTYRDEKTIAVHQVRSTDGLHWSKPLPIGIRGQISSPLEVSPGFVISVCNYRERPEGNRLWCSTDGGQTWCDRPIQMWDVAASRVTGQPAVEQGPSEDHGLWDKLPSFSFGTPTLLRLDDGTVLLTYYGMVNGITHVRACRFQIDES